MHGRPAAASPYELALAGGGVRFTLFPIYFRVMPMWPGSKVPLRPPSFRRSFDHPVLVVNELIGALAHLQVGRAYAMQGDTAKARAA